MAKNEKDHSKIPICMIAATAMIIALTSAFGLSRIHASENDKNTKQLL